MAILVRHAMTENPQTVSASSSAEDAAGLMKSEDVGALPVVDGEELIGIITDRDLVIRVLAERQDGGQIKVGDIATRTTATARPGMRLSEARDLMVSNRVRRLPVVEGDKLVGIISLGDVAVQGASERETGEALKAISDSESTESTNDGPAIGTPDRVMEHRGSD
jgi:CBS domain-containing protein